MGLKTLLTILFLTAVLTTIISEGIDTPPDFKVPRLKNTRYLLPKTNVTLLCEAEGKPPPTYRWTFNGDRINPSDVIRINSTSGTLTITVFTSNEEGNYQCFAENTISGNRAVAMSPVTTLFEAYLESSWNSPEKSTTLTEGDYLKLSCDNQPKCVPKPMYSWHLVENTVTGTNAVNSGEVKETDRIYIDNEGSLHFTYLTRSDSSGTLNYKCGLRNSVLEIIKLGNVKKLTVNAHANALPTVGARNVFKTNPAEFLTTKDAELECVFSGQPIPTITWKDKQKRVIQGNTEKYEIVNGRKLIVKKLEESDEGVYYCEGKNSKNVEEVSIFLDVKSGPIWTESISSQTRPEGTNAAFTCIARPAMQENPLNEPIWFRNGEVMDKTISGKTEFSEDFRVLTVMNLNKNTDIMCFQCNTSNEIGYEFADGCLNVIEPIFVLTQPALKQAVIKGQMINLTVIGTTDPRLSLKYRWYFKDKLYDGDNTPPFVTFDKLTNQSYIDTSSLNDEELASIIGTYHRELYHEYENKTVSIEVVNEIAVGAGVATSSTEIGIIIGICVAIIVLALLIILCVCYIRAKSEEGKYPLESKEKASGLNPLEDLDASRFKDVSRIPMEDKTRYANSAMVNPGYVHSQEEMRFDDDGSLSEYGTDIADTSKFNEDGSFIGQYKGNLPETRTQPTNHYRSESEL